MLWIYWMGISAVAAGQNNQLPKTGFSCKGRTTGYYADVESGCQVYHMCDGLGRQFSYTCPNATLFQQRMLICDHWYMVNCSRSVDDYTANLRIGHKEMPFVDDSESNPYHRTPRPDLLSHPSQSEYDIIYRTGRAQLGTNLNVVGVEPAKNRTTSSTTEESMYSLPSHWSTEYNKQDTTSKPKIGGGGTKKGFDGSTTIKRKSVVPVNITSSNNRVPPIPYQLTSGSTQVPSTIVPVNFKSEFKATTPVYPKTVDIVSEEPSEAGVLPPSTNSTTVNFESKFKATTPIYPKTIDITSEEPAEVGVLPPGGSTDSNDIPDIKVNFKSDFKATTPVYLKFIDITSEEPADVGVVPPGGQVPPSEINDIVNIKVNFKSDFKATTPVYPKTVDITSEEPSEVGVVPPGELLPPNEINDIVETKVNFQSGFKATTSVYPKSVDVISEDPGIVPPENGTNNTSNVPSLSLDFLPPEVDVNFNPEDRSQEVVPPSKFYQPPKFEPDFTEEETDNQETRKGGFKALNNDEWENLRKKFLIPDYEFPLESASRPSYDSLISSFQVSGVPSKKK